MSLAVIVVRTQPVVRMNYVTSKKIETLTHSFYSFFLQAKV